MIREKFISEPVVEGQPIEIVFAAENEIVELRQEIIQSCFHIQATEIESSIIAVVKDLLSRTEMPVERFCDLRIIISTHCRRDHHVALFAASCQRNIRCVENRRSQ